MSNASRQDGNAGSLLQRPLWRMCVSFGLLLLSACQAHTPSPNLVRIGLIAPFEGLHRQGGYDSLAAVRLAVDERNQAGGIQGRIVDLVALNDNGIPLDAAQQVDKLAVDPLVLGAIGPPGQAEAEQIAERSRSKSLPLVSVALSEPADGLVSVAAGLADARTGLAAGVAARGWQHVLLLDDQNPLSVAPLAEALFAAALEQAGVSQVQHQVIDSRFPLTVSTGLLQGVLYSGAVDQAHHMLSALALPWLGGPDLADAILIKRAPALAEQGAFLQIYPALDPAVPATAAFQQRYQAATSHAPSVREAVAYDAAQVLLDALASSDMTRAGVARALPQGSRQGATGPVQFDSDHVRRGQIARVVAFELADQRK